MKQANIDKRHVVSGPKRLAQDLPVWLNYTPYETLVIIGTNDDYVEQIIELKLQDNIDDEIKNVLDTDYAYIFCLFTKTPGRYKGLGMYLFMTENVHVRDVMWIKGNRWASYICADVQCCPKRGNKIVSDMKVGA